LRRKVFLAEDAIDIYKKLVANGIKVWVTGGWGIDALLGVQTRAHKDLDVILLLEDVVRMRELFEKDGYSLKELWSENRQAIDARGIETATAFVLHDAEGHELDVHAMHLDEQGNGIPDWDADEGFIFTKQDLSGEGMIAGFTVPCITPEKQVLCHKGYEMPDKQRFDLKLLNEKFGVDIPKE
jgi:lincosamide nucleotidyltransferase A/C/D/E